MQTFKKKPSKKRTRVKRSAIKPPLKTSLPATATRKQSALKKSKEKKSSASHLPSSSTTPATGNKKHGKKLASSPQRCEACHYVRTHRDNGPAWRCPKCHSAYAKVNQRFIKLERLRQKNREALKRVNSKTNKKIRDQQLMGAKGMLYGASVIASSVGATCARAASSPTGMIIGGAILLGSLIYLLSRLQ